MPPEKKKSDDPFEGMHFVGVFGLPIARYAYNFVDEPKKKKKGGKNETFI
jgi:hypothetical protein